MGSNEARFGTIVVVVADVRALWYNTFRLINGIIKSLAKTVAPWIERVYTFSCGFVTIWSIFGGILPKEKRDIFTSLKKKGRTSFKRSPKSLLMVSFIEQSGSINFQHWDNNTFKRWISKKSKKALFLKFTIFLPELSSSTNF